MSISVFLFIKLKSRALQQIIFKQIIVHISSMIIGAQYHLYKILILKKSTKAYEICQELILVSNLPVAYI